MSSSIQGHTTAGGFVDLTMDDDEELPLEADKNLPIETLDLSQDLDENKLAPRRSARNSPKDYANVNVLNQPANSSLFPNSSRRMTANLLSPHLPNRFSFTQWPTPISATGSASALAQPKVSGSFPARPTGLRSRNFEKHGHVNRRSESAQVVVIEDSEEEPTSEAQLRSTERIGANQGKRRGSLVLGHSNVPSESSSEDEEFPDLQELFRRSRSGTQSSSRPQSSSNQGSRRGPVPFLYGPENIQSEKSTFGHERPVEASQKTPQDHQSLPTPHISTLPRLSPTTPRPPISPMALRLSGKQPTHSSNRLCDPSTEDLPAQRGISSEPPPQLESAMDSNRRKPRGNSGSPMPSTEEIQEWLKQYEKRKYREQSKNCRVALRNARSSVQDTAAKFRDKVSPFASMKLVRVLPGESLPDSAPKVKTMTFPYKKNVRRTPGELLAKPTIGKIERVPKYTHHTAVRRNILEGDDDKLKYIPFFDDADENGCGGDKQKQAAARKLEKELQDHHKQFASTSSRESERNLQSQICLTALLRHLDDHCNLQALTFYIVDRYQNNKLELGSGEAEALATFLGTPNPEAIEAAEKIDQAWNEVFQSSLSDVVLRKERIKDILDSATVQENPVQHVTAPVQTVGTYTDVCCLICNTMHCQVHGDYIDASDDDEVEGSHQYHQQLIMHYPQTVRRHDARVLSQLQEDTPITARPVACSEYCYVKGEHSDEDFEWSEDEESFLKAVFVSKASAANEGKKPCLFSLALKRPCWQVYQMMQHIGPRAPQPDLRQQVFPRNLEWEHSRKWYDNKSKTLHDKWRQWTEVHDHQKRGQPTPCVHPGPCCNGCPCFNENILCEFYCDCGPSCSRKFTGCSCHSKGMNCALESCICIQMNRECGPECTSCGAVERINPDNRYDDKLFTTGCQNIVLQRGVSKKLFIGKSQLEGGGYGLYIAEAAKKGDYLDEYAGETITWSEADRRGIVYDLKVTSYLFDLNSRWAIDADRHASKTRFMNHANEKSPMRNSDAKVMWVRGEHRIKFIAIRNIKPGEELLFNYGEKFAAKHGLDKKQPTSHKAKTKKPQADAEAVEKALDDMQESARSGRRMAIRGGHSSRGRGRSRKARKIAGMSSPLAAAPQASRKKDDKDLMVDEEVRPRVLDNDEEMDPDFVGEDEDEDEDEAEEEESPPVSEEDDYESRRKRVRRNRRMPLKYTR